jgi:hypothetical protein
MGKSPSFWLALLALGFVILSLVAAVPWGLLLGMVCLCVAELLRG